VRVSVLLTSFSSFCVPLHNGQFRANTVPSNRTHNYANFFPRKATRISVLLRMSDEGSSFFFCPVSVFHQFMNVRRLVIFAVGTTNAPLHRAISLLFGFLLTRIMSHG